jgi:hypothetical protein
LRQIGGFLRVLRFPPPIKLASKIIFSGWKLVQEASLIHVFMNVNQVRIYPLVDLLFLFTVILSFNIDHVLLPPDYTCLFCEIRIYAGNTHAHIPLSFALKSIVETCLSFLSCHLNYCSRIYRQP